MFFILYLSHHFIKCHIKSEISEKTTPIGHNSTFIFRSVHSDPIVLLYLMHDRYVLYMCVRVHKQIHMHTPANAI